MSERRRRAAGRARGPAFAIAYRMLGSVAEAEDVVQEALLRVHRALEEGERIESPRAYAATVATRLAIDELRSARARRERYVGRVAARSRSSPAPTTTRARQAEMADSLSLAFLVLLERLSPEQRAVLLLRDVFDYGYDEIAGIVGKSEANVRQLAVTGAPPRRRSGGRASRPRASSATSWRGASSRRRRRATSAALEALLAHDVVLHGDGGGKVPALARALHGRSRVARTLLAWARQGRRDPGARDAAASRSTASRARWSSTARARCIGVDGARHRRRRRSRPCARSSTRTSSRTSARSATCARCCGATGRSQGLRSTSTRAGSR